MTGSYGLILPLMVANMISYGLARKFRPTQIYEALLEQDNIYLPHNRKIFKYMLDAMRIGEAMTTEVKTLRSDLSISEELEEISDFDYMIYPIVNSDSKCIGMISEVRMRREMAKEGGGRKIKNFVEKKSQHNAGQTNNDGYCRYEQS